MTYHPKSDFMHVMMERGYLADCTDYQGLDEALSGGVVTAYIGYDATAKSLHVGHLLNIMMLRWLQKDRAPADHADGRRNDQGREIRPSARTSARCSRPGRSMRTSTG